MAKTRSNVIAHVNENLSLNNDCRWYIVCLFWIFPSHSRIFHCPHSPKRAVTARIRTPNLLHASRMIYPTAPHPWPCSWLLEYGKRFNPCEGLTISEEGLKHFCLCSAPAVTQEFVYLSLPEHQPI